MYQSVPIPYALTLILAALPTDDAERVVYAFQFAAAAHGEQQRDEGSPFIDHPVAVASILWNELGCRDVDLLLAALCHDVLEDCPSIGEEMMGGVIGDRALDLVRAVTKTSVPDEQKSTRDRIYLDAIRHAPPDVRLLKLADRIHNLWSVMNARDAEKARRYLQVSREEFVPIAAATDLSAERLISEACDAIEAWLARQETG